MLPYLIRFLTVVSLTVFFSSCDCSLMFTGRVYAADTGLPLAGVRVDLADARFPTFTDSQGYFRQEIITGICPDIEYRLSLPGYKPFELREETDSKYATYAVRSESVFVPFNRPLTVTTGVDSICFEGK